MRYFYCQNGDCILLAGDFNARTAKEPDFADSTGDKFLNKKLQTSFVTSKKNNQDHKINNHGKNLLELCKTCNLRILIGCQQGDSFGKNTFYSNSGNENITGYITVSNFLVKFHNLLSNHNYF